MVVAWPIRRGVDRWRRRPRGGGKYLLGWVGSSRWRRRPRRSRVMVLNGL